MSKAIWWLILVFGFVLFATISYYGLLRMKPEPPAQPVAPVVAQPAAPAEPEIRHPVVRESDEKPLPALEASDASIRNALNELLSEKALVSLLQLDGFVRRVVATVDNLPSKTIALRLMPVKPAAGRFLVANRNGSLAIGADNAKRYASYLRLANSLDSAKLVALYIHFYPLFQQAYRELGYPRGYFNDRLIEAIDHLLATPEVKTPVKLVQPKVFYLFADAEIEALSAGQKLLIRLGSENTALIKSKLREIRNELTLRAGAGSKPFPGR